MTQPVHVQAPPPSLIGDKFLVRRKVFKLFGGAFHIYNASGQVVLYSRLKAFKLKEDIRLYTGEDMQTELLTIRARQILDIAATYDVIDATTGQRVGALRRRGLKSLIRDEWLILGPDEQEVGMIQEDSTLLALVRRFLTNLVPQKFHATVNGREVFTLAQYFNPFVLKLDLDFSMDPNRALDRRLAFAAAVLMCAIEGRQN